MDITNLREIIHPRADYQDYKISEKDFKSSSSNDFEGTVHSQISEKLNICQITDQTSLPHCSQLVDKKLVIRNRVGDCRPGIESYQTKFNIELFQIGIAADFYFKEDFTMSLSHAQFHGKKRDQMVKGDYHLYEYNKGHGGIGSGLRMTRKKSKTSSQQREKDYRSERIYRSLEALLEEE
ncbi:hypothetical protein Tco_0173546 [Tanacetum coccineum]